MTKKVPTLSSEMLAAELERRQALQQEQETENDPDPDKVDIENSDIELPRGLGLWEDEIEVTE
jgi:hypothetical protein